VSINSAVYFPFCARLGLYEPNSQPWNVARKSQPREAAPKNERSGGLAGKLLWGALKEARKGNNTARRLIVSEI